MHCRSHTQFVSFAHVTIETLAPNPVDVGENSEKHLSCPREQLESVQCGWLAHMSLPIMLTAKGVPLLPSPSSQDQQSP